MVGYTRMSGRRLREDFGEGYVMTQPRELAFGISQFTTWPWSFERDVERYAAHGVDAIEICQFKLNRNDYEPQLRRVRDAGLTVSSVQTTVHSLFPDSLAPAPVDVADRVAHIQSGIDRIAPHVPPGTPFVCTTGVAPLGNAQAAWDRAVHEFSALAEYAAAHGTRIAFEPLNPHLHNTDTSISTLDEGLELVREVGHDAFGLCVDVWNVFGTPDVERVIEACADRIFLVQVSDYRRPHSHADRLCLGEGSIPLAPLIAATRRAGYTGPFVLEILSSENLEDSIWKADLDHVIDTNIIAFERYVPQFINA